MSRKKWILLAVALIAALAVALGAGLVALDRYETVEAYFPTYADAQADGFDRRGWMPDYVPRSASGIRAAQNLDTNWQWLTFQVSPSDVRGLIDQGRPVSELPWSRAPFWLKWWPHDLERARHRPGFVRVSLDATPAHPERSVRCVAADTATGTVFAWTC